MDEQAERPFNEVFIDYVKISCEYADHPDTPKDAAVVVRKVLRRIREWIDEDEYEFPTELEEA
jgi:hypothetical protein